MAAGLNSQAAFTPCPTSVSTYDLMADAHIEITSAPGPFSDWPCDAGLRIRNVRLSRAYE